jgi:hypothetical protein
MGLIFAVINSMLIYNMVEYFVYLFNLTIKIYKFNYSTTNHEYFEIKFFLTLNLFSKEKTNSSTYFIWRTLFVE